MCVASNSLLLLNICSTASWLGWTDAKENKVVALFAPQARQL